MNKIELKIYYDKSHESVGIFDDVDAVKNWLEEFHQISFQKEKEEYENIMINSPSYQKYPELIKEFTLDHWFKSKGALLIYKSNEGGNRYENGELIIKYRMEDEEWYGNLYQPFLTFLCGTPYLNDVESAYAEALRSFKEFFNEELSEKDKERILRWCVLHVERQSHFKEFVQMENKLKKLEEQNKKE